jgi:Transcriptional regulator, AbiEi antitoxin
MQGKSPDDFVFTTAARSTSSAALRWTGSRRPSQSYKKGQTANAARQHLFPKMGTIVVVADATLTRLGAIAERRWGLVTTAQAEAAGVARKQLSRMASTGAIERVAQGVYRMAGAPAQDHEAIYATWLALGGAADSRTADGVATIVAAGTTAAALHEIGDFILNGFDFIVPARKGTRLPDVRLRIRALTREEAIPVNGLPTLSVERTIADLVEIGADLSLVADCVRDAVRADKLLSSEQLVSYLSPVAARRKSTGLGLANDLFQLAGAAPEGWDRH